MTTIAHPDVVPPTSVGARLSELVGRLRRREGEAAWVQPAHVALVALAAVLYLLNLTVSGFANTYYSAAAQAASQSWSAWFFGSLDAGNFITVDKPPLATMLMGLSVRILGLTSFAILLPEALAGVATVAVVYAIVRRGFGPAAATIAGLVTALTPAAVLMFRYNNPDALLTLLLVLAAGSLLRALDGGRLRWVIAAAVLVGLAFNTKYLQAYLVLPAFALTWFVAAPTNLRRRLVGLAVAGVAVLVSSGWWVLAVELIPAASRPFIGGSTNNSALDLVFGYDGLSRLFGQGGGPGGGAAGGPGAGGGFSGTPGLLRLFNAELGGQVGWLVPFALIGLLTGLALRLRVPRTDRRRAAYLLWGGWLLVHAVMFSFMSGILHSYYSVVLAPAIGALVGMASVDLWALRRRVELGGVPLGIAFAVSAVVGWQLLLRSPGFVPWLAPLVLVSGLGAAVLVALPLGPGVGARIALAGVALGLAAVLAGPAAYAIDTMQTAYGGGDPQAGPAVASSDRGPGGAGGGPGGSSGGPGGFAGAPGGIGGFPGASGLPGSGGAGVGGGPGGSASEAVVQYLVTNRGSATWLVAVSSANEAAPIQLETGVPVLAMGGFTGSDNALTVAELQAYVASGKLRYVLLGGGGAGGGFGRGDSAVTAWVAAHGTVVAGVGDGTLYDLAAS